MVIEHVGLRVKFRRIKFSNFFLIAGKNFPLYSIYILKVENVLFLKDQLKGKFSSCFNFLGPPHALPRYSSIQGNLIF